MRQVNEYLIKCVGDFNYLQWYASSPHEACLEAEECGCKVKWVREKRGDVGHYEDDGEYVSHGSYDESGKYVRKSV